MNGVRLGSFSSGSELLMPNSSSGDCNDLKVEDTKMLSINFATPLAGAARTERIKQMTTNHPAFVKSRQSQEILVKIQTSLRRMPGVSAAEANEIIGQLQEVGQTISTETSQLVDALMNVILDQEDTDKAVAKMSIGANLAKAEKEDQQKTMAKLREELQDEKEKREVAQDQVSKVRQELKELTEDFKSMKNREGSSDSSATGRTTMIKQLEETIRHLEGQVNNRRSLWIMKHSDPQAVARAIETLADSCPDKDTMRNTIMSLRSADDDNHITKNHVAIQETAQEPKKLSRVFSDMTSHLVRPESAFRPVRSMTAAPPKFGPLQSGPPRAPSAAPRSRPFQPQSPWLQNSPISSRFGFAGNGPATSTGFGRAPSRRGYHQGGTGAYRPNAPEFYPSGYLPSDREVIKADNNSFAFGGDQYPSTPSSVRNRYTPSRDATSPEFGSAYSNAVVSRLQSTGPLIHVTPMAVEAWNHQIMNLYKVIRNFVQHNASEPTHINPQDLRKTSLWPVLLATYHPLSEVEAISYLDYHLKDESSKSCLVTRVIIDYIVNRVWVPGAWTGSDPNSTYALIGVEREMEQSQGQTSSTRQPLLDRQASVIDSIMKREQNSGFARSKTEEIVRVVMATLQPLLNTMASPGDAYTDLEVVAEEAWGLSSKILTSRLTFDIRFPEVGCRFSCQSMIPIWPNMDALELQARHWRVALVTTPVITCRNDTGANISAHSVSLADVVCMQ